MGNPNPKKSKEFEAHIRKPHAETYSDRPLCKRPVQVFVGEDIYDALYALPVAERVDFLRKIISEAVREKYLE